MLRCCLRRNFEASRHKHFVVVSREKQTPSLKRLVSTCHGPAQMCVLHFAVEPFTARDGGKNRWIIATFAYPACILRHRIREYPSEYCHRITFGMEKLERCGYPIVKKIEDMFRFDRIHERDRHRIVALTHSIARQKADRNWRGYITISHLFREPHVNLRISYCQTLKLCVSSKYELFYTELRKCQSTFNGFICSSVDGSVGRRFTRCFHHHEQIP